MFSMKLLDSSAQSIATIGGYDMKYAKENAEIKWVNLINEKYWAVKITGFRTGDQTITFDQSAIVDSGSYTLSVPEGMLLLFSMCRIIQQNLEIDPK
jgi:hypothetical protein